MNVKRILPTLGAPLHDQYFALIIIFLVMAFSVLKPPAPPTLQERKDRAVREKDLIVGRVLKQRKLFDVDAQQFHGANVLEANGPLLEVDSEQLDSKHRHQ